MSALAGPRAAAVVALAVLGALGGCANMDVKKVPLAKRAANADHEEGFRYYLNRPYVVVKKPILIAESRSLVKVEPSEMPPYAVLKPPGQWVAAPPDSKDAGRVADKVDPSGTPPHAVLESAAGWAAAPPDSTDAGRMADAGQVRLTFLSGPREGQFVRLADLKVENPGSGSFRPVSAAELQRFGAALGAAPAADDQVALADASVTINDASNGIIAAAPAGAGAQNTAGPGEDQGVGALQSTSSSAEQSLDQPTLAAVQHAPPLVGDIAVIYLPDLDEQYAIKSCNVFSKTAFGLAFRNGGELAEVQGEHDSTALPLAILQQIQTAIQTAQGVEQERIKQEGKALQGAQGGKGGGAAQSVGEPAVQGGQMVWYLIERTWIKPGVYRLNKPWEMEGDQAQPLGCGLLAKLGLPTVVDVDFKPAALIKP
jgi:hypothetical protein